MVLSDTLLTVFEARGATAVINSFVRLEQSQNRLAVAQDKFNNARTPNAVRNAWLELESAQSSVFSAIVARGSVALGVLGGIAFGVHKIVSEYVSLGAEVMNIRDLTGATTGESVQAALLAKAAGINDPRSLLDLNKSVFQSGGQTALARLGIAATPNESGLKLFNQVANALDRYPDSLRKAQIMEEIFGRSGTEALLPLLRLTKDQRAQVEALGNGFSGRALSSIQEFQFATSMLGLTWQQKVIVPLGQMLLPLLQSLVTSISTVVDWMSALDHTLHGTLGVLLLAGAAMVAFVSGTYAIMGMIAVVKALNVALGITFGLEEGINAAAGNIIGLVAGAAAVIGGIVGIQNFGSDHTAAPSQAASSRQFAGAVDKFEANVNRMGDSFDSVKGNAIPRSLNSQDLPALTHAMANGVIG